MRSLIIIICLICFNLSSALGLSISEEKKMGYEFFKVVRQELPLISDPMLNSYYTQIGESLVKHLSFRPYQYHFFIINDPTLNAFSGPGGYVFMYRGLFLAFDSEDELAAVTAHEIGHVVNRHIAKRIERNKKLSLVALVGMLAGAALGGVNPSLATGVMTTSMAGSMALQLKYSRQDEEQADRTGLNLLIKSGYNGYAMVSAFKKLAKFSLETPGAIPAYLKTHPGLEERIVYISSALKNMGIKPIHRPQLRFKLMQARLRMLYTDAEAAKDYYEYRLKKNAHNPVPYYALGLYFEQNGEWAKALSYFKKAEAFYHSPLFLREMGICYAKANQFIKAIGCLKDLSLDAEAAFYLGWAFQNLGQTDKAISIWQQVANQFNERFCLDTTNYQRLFYYLGQAFNSINRPDWSQYYLGMYFKLKGQLAMAKQYFNKALKMTQDTNLKTLIKQSFEK